MKTYCIIRFRKTRETKGGHEIIKRGLTEQEAKEHCNMPDTKGQDWFDGYQEE
jgi:hypothetical protein